MNRVKDVILLKPKVVRDERGYFLESFHEQRYKEEGISEHFCQENHSCSWKGVVRGMHFQKGQAKLVYCPVGAVWDVVVDIRPDSPNFGKWEAFELNETNHHQLFIPDGFAHGFAVLSEKAYLFYKVSTYYDKEKERGFLWNDPTIGIKWPIKEPILSLRDRASEGWNTIIC